MEVKHDIDPGLSTPRPQREPEPDAPETGRPDQTIHPSIPDLHLYLYLYLYRVPRLTIRQGPLSVALLLN